MFTRTDRVVATSPSITDQYLGSWPSVLCAKGAGDKIRTRFFSPLSTGSRGVLCVLGLGCILFTSVVFQFVKYLSAATLIPKSDLLSQKHTGTFLFRLNYGEGGEESSL